MDSKALAKSKRAHTQHHSKKSHSSHKPKAAGGSENARKPEELQGNQTAALKAKSLIQSRRVSALPSNWDRYDDDDDTELDLGVRNSFGDMSTSQPADVILPKSKGADYLHLISEAQAESQSKIDISSDCLSSLDDLLQDEFSRVVGSMLSARGEGILSWLEDDNFVVEKDGSASNNEPEFLSLNLSALAKTLEKVDLHERLYIEADLLLPELCTTQSNVTCNEEPSHSHTTQDCEAVTTRLNEIAQQESSGKLKVTDEKIDPIVWSQGDQAGVSVSPVFEPDAVEQVKNIPILADESGKSSALEADLDMLLYNSAATIASTSNQGRSVNKSSTFKGISSAETELDSLLNSYGDAAGIQESCDKPYPSRDSTNPSGQKLHTTAFDDELDDLLELTSGTIKPQQNQSSSSSSLGKSKVLDDYDSWLDTI